MIKFTVSEVIYMVKFPTLKTAVERAQGLRAGRYGVILYNPRYNEFSFIGPYIKNLKFVFAPNEANCSYLIVDHWVGSYEMTEMMFEWGLFKPVNLNEVYKYDKHR